MFSVLGLTCGDTIKCKEDTAGTVADADCDAGITECSSVRMSLFRTYILYVLFIYAHFNP